jgi:hypothetical protein
VSPDAATVPGEGVEPSRAEAHGFLRPARLPIPPSRPSRSRVAARSKVASLRAGAGLAALLTLTISACTERVPPSARSTVPTIAFLFDGSSADAELVTAPALAGLELAAGEAIGVEVEPVNVGLERNEVMASLRTLGDDQGIVAAVVAPWTAPPPGAVELLAEGGVPVVTLSWAWGPPLGRDGQWLSLVAPRAREAVILLTGAEAAPEGSDVCLAGDDHPTSRALLETAEELGRAAGDPAIVMAGIAPAARPAAAKVVAARIADAGCPTLVWTGGTIAARSVLSSAADPPVVVGASRIKTDDGLGLAASGIQVVAVCACADVSLSMEPDEQRFVHDLQAQSGAPPGPFAVEAYDAGRLLTGLLAEAGVDDRRELVAEALIDLSVLQGLSGAYAFEPDGSRSPGSIAVRRWRAAGSRWLPMDLADDPPS